MKTKAANVVVLLELLNGEKLQFFCPASATGQQLFDVMLREVDLPEFFFFGLTHVMGEYAAALMLYYPLVH